VVLVTVGVDTHVDVHVAVALDQLGRRMGSLTFPTSAAGYGELVAWVGRLGRLERVGVEGAGSVGAGLIRWLRARGVMVLEVARPNRRLRRHAGKSDQIDGEALLHLAITQTGVLYHGPLKANGDARIDCF
jgi:transposase